LGRKVPGSKPGRPLIYCGSKVSLGWVRAHLYPKSKGQRVVVTQGTVSSDPQGLLGSYGLPHIHRLYCIFIIPKILSNSYIRFSISGFPRLESLLYIEVLI